MMGAPVKSSWILVPKPSPLAKVRLFCFPYAGGGTRIYRMWPNSLPDAIELCTVSLPGREGRIREAPFRRLLSLVERVATELTDYLDKPFALFGHSMGAIISFELARHLRRTRGIEPAHLFVSGRAAPQIPEKDPPTYNLPVDELIALLRRLNGTPREVIENPELLQLVLPLLRADFEMIQTYEYQEDSPLACPITSFGGLADVEVSREDIVAWQAQTARRFTPVMLPGDHFFINTQQSFLLRVVSRELRDFMY